MHNSTVHGSHCCKEHGCKYSDDNCPVVLGAEPQEFKQGCCDYHDKDLVEAYKMVIEDVGDRSGGDEVAEFLKLCIKDIKGR